MRNIFYLWGMVLLTVSSAYAVCDNIKDNDTRANCQAIAYNNRAYCDRIHDHDKRAYCSAKLTRNPALCDQIHDLDLRTECRTFVK